MPVKYGRVGHPPRCSCPDCQASYLEHNRGKFCDCYDCTCHREIDAPAPSNGVPDQRYGRYFDSRDYQGPPKYEPPKAKERLRTKEAGSMTTIHMCERCDSIIKGPAMGLLDIAPNVDAERKGWELCPPCVRDVWEVLQSKPAAGTRERAYDTPFDPQKEAQGTGDAVEDATLEQLLAAAFQKAMRQAAIEAPAIPRSTYHDDDDE